MKRVPNILSALRILLAPLFMLMYLQDDFLWASASMLVFVFAAITDYLDGYLARRYNVSTGLGTFLDPLADKILTFTGFICIPFIDADQFPWWIIIIILFRDIFITWMRLWSEQNNYTMQTRYSAKIKTFIQMFFLYIVLFIGVAIKTEGIVGDISQKLLETGVLGVLFYIVMIVTVYTALEYIYINRRLFTSE